MDNFIKKKSCDDNVKIYNYFIFAQNLISYHSTQFSIIRTLSVIRVVAKVSVIIQYNHTMKD